MVIKLIEDKLLSISDKCVFTGQHLSAYYLIKKWWYKIPTSDTMYNTFTNNVN